jgi:hypothetical protein
LSRLDSVLAHSSWAKGTRALCKPRFHMMSAQGLPPSGSSSFRCPRELGWRGSSRRTDPIDGSQGNGMGVQNRQLEGAQAVLQCGGSGHTGSRWRRWRCSRWRVSSYWPLATSISVVVPAIRMIGRLRPRPGKRFRPLLQSSRPPTFRCHPVKTSRASLATIFAPFAPASD